MATHQDAWQLSEFIKYFILPQRVKVVEGYYSPDHELSVDDLIHLMEVTCPKAALIHPSTGRKLSVPSSHPARFQVVCSGGRGSVLRGVRAVAATRPLAVRLTAPYSSCADAALQLKKGDHLKLLRFVQRGGRKFIECKSSHLSRLVLLPVWDEAGEFEERASDSYYTLADLMSTLPRPERRVKLAADIINERNPLPGGIKAGTELVLQQPLIMVKYYLVNSPGTIKEIPATLDISVSAREDTYSGQFQAGYPLKHFVADNRRSLPLKAIVSDWFEQSTIADNHDVTPGVTLMFHDVAEQQKILATCGDACFAIPKSYAAEFRFVARTFSAVCELPATHKGFTFRVTAACEFTDAQSGKRQQLSPDVVYQVAGLSGAAPKQALDVQPKDKPNVLLHVPVSTELDATEVIAPHLLPSPLNLPALSQQDTEFPIRVMFPDPCPAVLGPARDPLPRGEVVTLQAYIREETVLVSKAGSSHGGIKTSFHLPVRSELLMTYLGPAGDRLASAPPPSAMDQCPELVSQETYTRLLADYERVYYMDAMGLSPEPKPALPQKIPLAKSASTPHLAKPAPTPHPKTNSLPRGTPKPGGPAIPPKAVPPKAVPRKAGPPVAKPPAPLPTTPQPPTPQPPKAQPPKAQPPVQAPRPKAQPPTSKPPAVLPPKALPPKAAASQGPPARRAEPPKPHPRSSPRTAPPTVPKSGGDVPRVPAKTVLYSNNQKSKNKLPPPPPSEDQLPEPDYEDVRSSDEGEDYEAMDPADHIQGEDIKDANDEDEDKEDYLVMETTLREMNIKDQELKLPADGNLSSLNAYQMVSFLQDLGFPQEVLDRCRDLPLNGPTFAGLTDAQLVKYGIDKPIVRHFRDRSKQQLYTLVL